MYHLKNEVEVLSYDVDRALVFRAIVSELRNFGIPIEKQDEENGEIVVRYLSTVHNWIFWRCWSDRVLLEVKQIGQRSTKVVVFLLPSLFRIKIRKNETVRDPRSLISKLRDLRPEKTRS